MDAKDLEVVQLTGWRGMAALVVVALITGVPWLVGVSMLLRWLADVWT